MKLLMVVNPISGGKDKETFISAAEELCQTFRIHWEYFHTSGINDEAECLGLRNKH